MSMFLHSYNADAKAIAIPWVSSENNQANNVENSVKQHTIIYNPC